MSLESDQNGNFMGSGNGEPDYKTALARKETKGEEGRIRGEKDRGEREKPRKRLSPLPLLLLRGRSVGGEGECE